MNILTYVHAAERVQRFLLRPGQQQHSTDFIHSNFLDPGFRRGDEEFFSNLLSRDMSVLPIGRWNMAGFPVYKLLN